MPHQLDVCLYDRFNQNLNGVHPTQFRDFAFKSSNFDFLIL